MFKVSHTTLIALSGLTWLIVGGFLFTLGLNFIVESLLQENLHRNYPLLNSLAPWVGGLDPAALVLIGSGAILGFFKARFIFSKTVNSTLSRILSLPNPSSLGLIYTKKYYILLGSMIFLGFLVRFTPNDIRGLIDVTIGSALISGALLYFKAAFRVFRLSH